MRPPKTGIDFGTSTPTFGPAAKLPDLTATPPVCPLSPVKGVRGDGTGQTRKYGNRKVAHPDGYTFDSKKEAKRYEELKLLQAAGKIFVLAVHPVYPLFGRDQSTVYTYTADFAYQVKDEEYLLKRRRVVEDCKSVATRKKDTWRLIKKLFRSSYGFSITEI